MPVGLGDAVLVDRKYLSFKTEGDCVGVRRDIKVYKERERERERDALKSGFLFFFYFFFLIYLNGILIISRNDFKWMRYKCTTHIAPPSVCTLSIPFN